MQNWLSNILDIPELTSKIVILGKCSCQGATDILIKHIILMFKNSVYSSKIDHASRLCGIKTLHNLHSEDRADHRPEKWQANLTF